MPEARIDFALPDATQPTEAVFDLAALPLDNPIGVQRITGRRHRTGTGGLL